MLRQGLGSEATPLPLLPESIYLYHVSFQNSCEDILMQFGKANHLMEV